jgi:hypothetical protein
VHLEAKPGERSVKFRYIPLETGPAPGPVNVVGQERSRQDGIGTRIVIAVDGFERVRASSSARCAVAVAWKPSRLVVIAAVPIAMIRLPSSVLELSTTVKPG